MRYIKNIIAFIVICLLFVTCEKNKDESPLEFKLCLLDKLGNEKTEFNYGENIIFSFQVKNNTSENLMLKNFFENENVFRVFKINDKNEIIDYGTPYDLVAEIGYFSVNASKTLYLNCSWKCSNGEEFNSIYFGCLSDKPEQLLEKGNYYTSFSESFIIGENIIEKKYFKINFIVK